MWKNRKKHKEISVTANIAWQKKYGGTDKHREWGRKGALSRGSVNYYKTHGMSNTPIWWAWQHMKSRCNNDKNKDYKHYGGRGITFSRSWEKFDGFYADMKDGYEKGLTLERINVDGNYCKKNCRWATRREQSRNTRANRTVEYMGKIRFVYELAEEYGIKRSTLWQRLFIYKMTIDEALSKEKFPRRKKKVLLELLKEHE